MDQSNVALPLILAVAVIGMLILGGWSIMDMSRKNDQPPKRYTDDWK